MPGAQGRERALFPFEKAKDPCGCLKATDEGTAEEQAELLKAFKSFLDKRAEVIEKRMASIRGEEKSEGG